MGVDLDGTLDAVGVLVGVVRHVPVVGPVHAVGEGLVFDGGESGSPRAGEDEVDIAPLAVHVGDPAVHVLLFHAGCVGSAVELDGAALESTTAADYGSLIVGSGCGAWEAVIGNGTSGEVGVRDAVGADEGAAVGVELREAVSEAGLDVLLKDFHGRSNVGVHVDDLVAVSHGVPPMLSSVTTKGRCGAMVHRGLVWDKAGRDGVGSRPNVRRHQAVATSRQYYPHAPSGDTRAGALDGASLTALCVATLRNCGNPIGWNGLCARVTSVPIVLYMTPYNKSENSANRPSG